MDVIYIYIYVYMYIYNYIGITLRISVKVPELGLAELPRGPQFINIYLDVYIKVFINR